MFWWPNTNTNIIRLSKNDRIRIRILFDFPKMTEYEYEYYSAFQKWPNTNTNNIRLSKNERIRIRILFGLKKHLNMNTNIIRDWCFSLFCCGLDWNPSFTSWCLFCTSFHDRGCHLIRYQVLCNIPHSIRKMKCGAE